MTAARRYLTLNAYLRNSGNHEAAWRVSPAGPASLLDPRHYIELARTAERGMLDSTFLPDSPGVADFRSEYLPCAGFDPLQLLSSAATATEQVGLIATMPTTYSYSWDVARRLATLDFLSHGRAGWNIVTTTGPAAAEPAEYAGRILREHIGLPRPPMSVAPFPRAGNSTTQGGQRSRATTAASPTGDLR
jgi:alkanesulfonate monooxygenase SsuD/methylene tetrahydromethanopterin reductase-like flavin-dependent oxidoreductase (luciferase family)